jgi:hypothetical protein
MKTKQHVGEYYQKIESVKEYNRVAMINEFVQNPAAVAGENKT